MFDRYHIVSERRMKQNAQTLEALLKTQENTASSQGSVQDVGASQVKAPQTEIL